LKIPSSTCELISLNEISKDAEISKRTDPTPGSADPSETVRRGSPFAASNSTFAKTDSTAATSESLVAETAARWEPANHSSDYYAVSEILDPEWGALRAAIWASAWVAIFSVACFQLFPGGGVIVASLGCGLAIVGLFSSQPIPAAVLLATHAGLFFGCYQSLF
jgi:hypothetical protein